MSAQRSPGAGKSSRNQALDIGTDPRGFPTDLPYDSHGGYPLGTPGNGGAFRDNPPGPNPVVPLPPQPKPFK